MPNPSPKSNAADTALSEFGQDVRDGLTMEEQKELPSKYLYDDLGSHLFESITLLPEYGPTNADARLARKYAAEIADSTPPPVAVAELGSGSGKKTRWILEELAERQPTNYYPIDISSAAIGQCQREMESVPGLDVRGIEGEYVEGLRQMHELRPAGANLLLLFLGSTIGNFRPTEAEEYLKAFRSEMEEGDHFLLSTDLVKPVEQTLPAYDDPTGVTAAFNKNLLTRINNELDGDFDLSEFDHLALYNHEMDRVEMHLVSNSNQTVEVPGADVTVEFEKDETIWTECSHKYTLEKVRDMADESGFNCKHQWVDEEWPFAQTLMVAS